MARPLRIVEPNGIYHVGARGVRRREIFHDEFDWKRYVGLLGDAVRAREWLCHGYCLMPNHVHLLLQSPEGDLSDGMHDLQLAYARRFNARHGFTGHLFEARFWAKQVDDDGQALSVARYIALNPVRAGLCEAPAQWRWSSYAASIDATSAARFLDVERGRRLFGAGPDAFRSFIELTLPE